MGRRRQRVHRLHVLVRADDRRLRQSAHSRRRGRPARPARHRERPPGADRRPGRALRAAGRPRRVGHLREERQRRDDRLQHGGSGAKREAQDPRGGGCLPRRRAVGQPDVEGHASGGSRPLPDVPLQRRSQPRRGLPGGGRRPRWNRRVRLQARRRPRPGVARPRLRAPRARDLRRRGCCPHPGRRASRAASLPRRELVRVRRPAGPVGLGARRSATANPWRRFSATRLTARPRRASS